MKPSTLCWSALCCAILLATAPAAIAQSGEVVFYGFAGNHVQPLIQAFNKYYPDIKVHAITLQGPAIIARLRAEKNHPQADVANTASDLLLENTDLIDPDPHSHEADFPSWAVIRDGNKIYGYGYSIAMQVFMINTSQMKPADAPHSWKDLLKPQFHGKFLLGNPGSTTAGYDSYAQMLQIVGPEEIGKFINNAVFSPETNLVPQEVARGEIPMGLVEETKANEMREQGYPVTIIYPAEGVVPTVDGWSLVKNRPHPENAQLFLDFVNSKEGQDIDVAFRNRRVPRKDANEPKGLPPMASIKINSDVDVMRFTTERKANIALFNKLFAQKQ